MKLGDTFPSFYFLFLFFYSFTLFTLEAVQAVRLFSHCLQLNTFRSHGGSRHTNFFNYFLSYKCFLWRKTQPCLDEPPSLHLTVNNTSHCPVVGYVCTCRIRLSTCAQSQTDHSSVGHTYYRGLLHGDYRGLNLHQNDYEKKMKIK